MTDNELLAAFTSTRSESAFAELVQRHGQMVYTVCLRITGRSALAEEATQATFLVLASKAKSLTDRATLGGWLYHVAENASRKLLFTENRRHQKEQEAAAMSQRQNYSESYADSAALWAVLDSEIAQLSEVQRQVVVGLYLEGHTQAQLAEILGVPEGTVATRYKAALEKLRQRVARRKVVASVALLAATLSTTASATSVEIPASLAASLPTLATQFVATGASGTAASILAKGVLKQMFWAKMKIAACVLTASSLVGSGLGVTAWYAQAEEKPVVTQPVPVDNTKKVKSPLAELPSKPGPHIDKIKAMADNTWLALGSPAPDPVWGDGIGRAYTFKMEYTEDRRGAFLYGEGVHGATTKRNGKMYYNDDLFFYDINGHRWVCAYPGFEIDTYTTTVFKDKDGLEATKDGPLPIACVVHGYGNLTYDPVRKIFMSMFDPAGGGYYRNSMPEREVAAKELQYSMPGSPFMFDTVTGRWTAKKTETPFPRFSHSADLYYLDSCKKVAYFAFGVHYYDPANNTWRKVSDKQNPGQPTCHDTKRDRLYFVASSSKGPDGNIKHILMAFDVATEKWIDLNPKGDVMLNFANEGSCVATMQYDSVNDVVVFLMHSGKPENCGVMIYSPEKNEWTLAKTNIPGSGQATSSFYDPVLNAHFIFRAGDSEPFGKMFVYRYKQAAKK